ncbi:mechanosensitive ion channel family protein [Spirosoma pulveris]
MFIRLFSNLLLVLIFFHSATVPVVAQDTTATIETSVPQTIPDTLLFKIQKAQSVISQIKAANKRKYGISRIRSGLADVKANLAPIATDMRAHGKEVDTKNMVNYSLILNDGLKKLTDWRTTLSKSNNYLQSNLDQVLALSTDSLLTVNGTDTTDRKLYADQIRSIKFQLQDAGTRTSAQLDTVSRLLADVSGTYLTISNLQAAINDRLQKSSENTFQKEAPYLWEAPASLSLAELPALLQSSFQGQSKIFTYFVSATWDNRILLIMLCGLFFAWVFFNYKKAQKSPLREKITPLRSDYLKPVPVVASLIVLLNLTPLFEPQSPSLYVEITQFLLFVVLTVQFRSRLSRHELRMWLLIGTMYMLLVTANALVGDLLFMRLGLIALNIGFLYIGIVFARRLPRQHISARVVRFVTTLFMVFQVLAIVLNCLGRISLAKTLGITAVIGLMQLTALGTFIEVILEALDLQINVSTSSEGIFSRVNVSHIRRSFRKGLSFIAVTLWLIVFFINIGAADTVFNILHHILTRPRSFGSLTFTLSNVLSFSIIIYLSSLLQKNIGLLFGESQLPTETEEIGQLSSVLALVRLVIVIAGVLLAIATSGISVDKFTVVLGALSVGIGLGMQNIVSNFVSGIILIFEKPFKIGDYVELADKKGRIRDIGIRSSRMITPQGSEVIIPNGDLLSNRLVNWTSGDTYLKTEFTLKVSMDSDLEAVQEIINKEVSQLEGTLQNRPAEVTVTGIGGTSVDLKVQVWLTSVYAEVTLKSQLLQRLLIAFKGANVTLV